MLKKFRFSTFPTYNLASVINPSIMKLTEKEDKTGMFKLGPFYECGEDKAGLPEL